MIMVSFILGQKASTMTEISNIKVLLATLTARYSYRYRLGTAKYRLGTGEVQLGTG